MIELIRIVMCILSIFVLAIISIIIEYKKGVTNYEQNNKKNKYKRKNKRFHK
ncbi:unnamed protein product [marine sediment metagenome]|uniref:Uncharacterized protein n=1 Tax=marine sediment metagenome TaxID=412755 RepID=X0TTI6_9ZZZZ